MPHWDSQYHPPSKSNLFHDKKVGLYSQVSVYTLQMSNVIQYKNVRLNAIQTKQAECFN